MNSIRDFERITFRKIEQAVFRIACEVLVEIIKQNNGQKSIPEGLP
jgi:hypothetical protein